MKIRLKTEPRGEFRDFEVKKGTRIEEIYRQVRDELPYTILLAKVGNEYQDLNFVIEEECSVELLDMRTQAANLVYQYGLVLIYLTAVKHVLGDTEMIIDNSLNQGLYVYALEGASGREIRQIEDEMRRLVEEDVPIEHHRYSAEEGIKLLIEMKRYANLRELQFLPEKEHLDFYQLEDYQDYFYGKMVPSTGYIRHFELRSYRGGVLIRFPLPANPEVIPEYKDQVRLAEAFDEQGRWDRLLGVDYVGDLNKKIVRGEAKELMMLSEALHEKKIAEIADMIMKRKKRIILIAGPSSSGKTTFARRLCIQLKVNGMDALYMGTDDYFVERSQTPLDEHGEPNYEDLDAIDIGLFNQNMNDLLAGREVDLPTFNFIEGKKEYSKRITRLRHGQPIVIEGIHGLNGKLTEQIPAEEKFKIYISPLTQLNIDEHVRIPTTDERMLRRMVRDYQFRAHDARSTIADWPKVRAGEDKNIFPYSDEADVLFNSYHVYEISVLKKYAQPLLEKIRPDEPEYAEAQRILKFLNFFLPIEDDSVIVNNSILREFIGGSVFVE